MTNGKQQQVVEYDEGEAKAALIRAGASQIQQHAPGHETAGAAMAERARALVEARAIMAIRNPRSWDDVRTRLLNECRRPGFAKAARYRKPVGDGIEGPSIRFAEAAIRYMRNLAIETTVVYDDEAKQILRVSVTDLEANVPYEQDVVVTKTVERRKPPRGDAPFRTRANSFGDTIYILAATDDECLNKTNALVSKALRTQALRLLPGDILDECMALCIQVSHDEDARDPDAARKAMASAFFSVGVSAGQLAEYLGHDLAQVTPAELLELRALYSAIRDAETSWAEVMDSRGGSKQEGSASKVAEIVAKHKAKKGKGKAEQKPEPPPAESNGELAEDPPMREPGVD
jgi:hypothetical protein